jgi:flagellar biosynthesis protein FlhG
MMSDDDQAVGLRALSAEPRAYRLRHAEGGPHVVAVTSGKGGVGKTQLSANLAVALAQDGKRVLLLDADLGLASLDLALGLSPDANLLSVLKGERTVREIIVEGPSGVHLIPACPGRYDMANLTVAQREHLWTLVQEASADFDVLIIDTGAGIGSSAVGFASYAHDVLLVTTPDPTALRDAYAMAKVLHRRAGVERVQVIANQVDSERAGAELHERMRAIVNRFLTLDLAYLGAIPLDPSVRESNVAGKPFVLRAPGSPAARAVGNLVRRLRLLRRAEGASC